MAEYIEKQVAIDALTENKEMINAVLDSLTLDYNTRRNQEQRRGQIDEDIETIKAIPAADVLVPVRCHDCKYASEWRSEGSAKKFGQIYECMRGILTCPDPNDFCSRGDRRK